MGNMYFLKQHHQIILKPHAILIETLLKTSNLVLKTLSMILTIISVSERSDIMSVPVEVDWAIV